MAKKGKRAKKTRKRPRKVKHRSKPKPKPKRGTTTTPPTVPVSELKYEAETGIQPPTTPPPIA
jgi:hypothetical protein